jgi:nucleoside-diphosphate-sugar epimerase
MRPVVHAAGLTNALHPDEYYQVNSVGTLRLWMAAESLKVKRFLLVSSLAAAGPSQGEEPQDETARPHPVSAYGKSKLQAERVVLQPGGPLEPVVVRPPRSTGRATTTFSPWPASPSGAGSPGSGAAAARSP